MKKPPSPIHQISPIEYLSNDKEPLPEALKNHEKGKPISVRELLSSRIVYNPGAGIEGNPIRTFNKSHASHVYIYVDYFFSEETIDRELSNDAFYGYHLYSEQDLTEGDLIKDMPRYHLTNDERKWVIEQYQHVEAKNKERFGILKIYERDESFREEHGALRFAIIYLGGDAIASYDAIFGNTGISPYASVVDSYSFCDAYDGFGKGSLIEKIAQRTNSLPKYLICASHCNGWDGYERLKTVSGTPNRFLWERKEIRCAVSQ